MGNFSKGIAEGLGQGLGIIIIFVIIIIICCIILFLIYRNASFSDIAIDMIKKSLNL